MGPETLAQIMQPLKTIFKNTVMPDLLLGLDQSDDAAVYRISEDIAVIQTLDFFTPIVDNPYDFGAIAATNALNDIYAMGGKVILALNICGFPKDLPIEIISEILRGGAEKVAEAGGVLAGGHTIEDPEPKYGLSVMGTVHPDKIFTTKGAQPGDILILTKPLGVGIVTTAFKADMASCEHIAMATEVMKKLNRNAAGLLGQIGIHACTDVTGFSLLGHCTEITQLSNVRLSIEFENLPFVDGAKEYADEWLFPGGACRNEKYYSPNISFSDKIAQEMRMLLFTPETAGGLLAAVAPEKCDEVRERFTQSGEEYRVIGKFMDGKGIEVV